MTKIKRHNKKRNSALLYEFLVGHISKCLVGQNKEEAHKAVALSKKYFAKGKVLHQELVLFNAIIKTNVKSDQSARKILNAVKRASKPMNDRRMDAAKSKLIKEINYTFGKDSFYKYKVPNYKVYASLHTLLNEDRKKSSNLGEVERIKLEDSICHYLIREPDVKPEVIKVNPDYNNAVYKFVVERFYNKYDGKISRNQTKLLMEYASCMTSNNKDKDRLKEVALKEIVEIKKKLRTVQDKSTLKDADLMTKINECYKKFVSTNFDNVTDKNILDILQFMKLTEEIQS